MMVGKFWRSFIIALGIACVVFLLSNDFGIVWDEPIHFKNGDQYLAWVKKPHWGDKDEFFRVSSEQDVHPPLRKFLAAVTHDIGTNRLAVIDNTRGYRISALLFVIPFVTVLAYVGGIFAAFLFSFLPHVFFLTPLVTMDYAVAALWFVTVMFAMKGRKSILALIIAGVAMGCTMLTKLHGFLLIIPVLVILGKNWKKSILVFTIASVVFYCGWPWLWGNFIAHLSEFFSVQASHGSVPVLFFGHIYPFAPWWYSPVMFLVTTPVFVLAFFFIGVVYAFRKNDSLYKQIFFQAMYPLIFFSLPGIYRYDWVRLFLPSFPFVCLMAARGIGYTVSVSGLKKKSFVLSCIWVLWIVTLVVSVIRIHPFEGSYYNELVGGIAGARALGLETDYWGSAYLQVLPWMNAQKGAKQCVSPTTHPFYYYMAMGQLEGGVEWRTPVASCKYLILLMRQGLFIRDPFVALLTASNKPIHTVSIDGVPIVGVYDIGKQE